MDGSKTSACVSARADANAHELSVARTRAMKTIMDRAIGAESAGEVSNASVFGGFPLADVPEAGLFVAVAAGSANAATELADELADMAWERREDFVFKTEPLENHRGSERADRIPYRSG